MCTSPTSRGSPIPRIGVVAIVIAVVPPVTCVASSPVAAARPTIPRPSAPRSALVPLLLLLLRWRWLLVLLALVVVLALLCVVLLLLLAL